MNRYLAFYKIITEMIKKQGGSIKLFKKIFHIIKYRDFDKITRIFSIITHSRNKNYEEWIIKYDSCDMVKLKNHNSEILSASPLISIVIFVKNPNLEWLTSAVESVMNQIYSNWELVISCDKSIKSHMLAKLNDFSIIDSRIRIKICNSGNYSFKINDVLRTISGKWVSFLGQNDVLSKCALLLVIETVRSKSDLHLIYSDEDQINEKGERLNPNFKCDWNLDLFYSQNLNTNFGIFREELFRTICRFDEGDQHYDVVLRYVEKLKNEQIYHIPKILYHNRFENVENQKSAVYFSDRVRSLNAHFNRMQIRAHAVVVESRCRVHYELPVILPLVTLIIPTRNGLELIRTCIQSIIEKTSYKNYEILIIDNSSDDPDTLKYFKNVCLDERVRVVRDDRPFNYSAINNVGVDLAKGEIVGLLNNDLEVISPEWLSEMVSLSLRSNVGAVGAKLLYSDNTLQHGGVILGIGGVAGHAHKHLHNRESGYHGRAVSIQSLSAVTAACLVIRKKVFKEVGGLNEQELKIAFNDVDFCLRVREAGYHNIWTPYAELYHHESASRGFEDTPEKIARFKKEVQYMKKRWGDLLLNDPAYNPNLTLDHEDFGLAWPPRQWDLNNKVFY